MPTAEKLTTPLWYTLAERDLLRGTNLHGATEEREAKWREEWQALPKELETEWETYLWSATMLSSRAFGSSLLPDFEGESTPIFLPGIDAFNHRRGQKVLWNKTDKGLELVTEADLPAGASRRLHFLVLS